MSRPDARKDGSARAARYMSGRPERVTAGPLFGRVVHRLLRVYAGVGVKGPREAPNIHVGIGEPAAPVHRLRILSAVVDGDDGV